MVSWHSINHVYFLSTETHLRLAREAVDPSQVCARTVSQEMFIANAGVFGNVVCDSKTEGGGWIVILRRFNGLVNFYRSWADYKSGFGDVRGEFWMGNFNVFLLTSTAHFDLRVHMQFQGKTYYAKYSSFRLARENDNYRLHIAEFLGGNAGDSLSYHNNSVFSTFDNDNNRFMENGNCVMNSHAPWWYKMCMTCLLFGQWKGMGVDKGVHWVTLTGNNNSLDAVKMMIRMNTNWY